MDDRSPELPRRLQVASLSLSFAWIGDRWSHEIRYGDGPAPLVQAESIDPPPGRPECLISPAYQELTQPGDGPPFLLLGRSGSHHHSAVVTVTPEGFRFDVANRCSLPSPKVSATYLLELTSNDLIEAGVDRIVWRAGGGRLLLTAEPPASLSLAEAGRRCTRVQVLIVGIPDQRTQRLAYRWEWNGSPGGTRVAANAGCGP